MALSFRLIRCVSVANLKACLLSNEEDAFHLLDPQATEGTGRIHVSMAVTKHSNTRTLLSLLAPFSRYAIEYRPIYLFEHASNYSAEVNSILVETYTDK